MNRTTADIIKELRLKRGLSQEDLGKKVGVQKSAINKYEKGRVENLKRTTLEGLADALGVTPVELLGYEDEEQQNQRAKKIPVLGNVVAGIPLEAIEEILDWEEIPADWHGEYFALKVKGDSMEPKISEGDVVIVKKQEDIECGDTAIVLVNGEDATVKKIIKNEEGITLVATNTSVFLPRFYTNKEVNKLPVEIIGKVVELRAKF
jgi:repressor LexA